MIPLKHHGHGSCEDSCSLKITDLRVTSRPEPVLKASSAPTEQANPR